MNSLLTEIYKTNPQNDDDIYTYFQQIERDVPTDLMQHKEEYSKEFEEFNSCWNIWTEIYNRWVQIECCKGKDYCVTGLTRIKAYISVNDPEINNMFITIIKNILSSAQKSFGIKAARYLRADTICVWISLEDLKLLENACLPYADHISRKLHFMPYKGKIAISKDLIGDVSYNYVIANMIETYLKSIKSVDEIDVFKLYDLFIDQWNRKPPYKDSMFVDMSAFTFMVILDSLEAILSGKELTCNSSLFCQDDSVLAALERGHCWGDVKLRTGGKI